MQPAYSVWSLTIFSNSGRPLGFPGCCENCNVSASSRMAAEQFRRRNLKLLIALEGLQAFKMTRSKHWGGRGHPVLSAESMSLWTVCFRLNVSQCKLE